MKTNLFALFYFSFICVFIISCSKESEPNFNAPCNNFEKTFGDSLDDYANAIIIKNQEIFVFGTSKSFGDINGDHYLIKMSLYGDVIFENTYGGSAAEEGLDIIATNDGNFILIGTTESSGAGQKDIHVIKIDPNGNQIWENTFGGTLNDVPNDIIELSSGEFCITGVTESFGSGMRDIYVLWIDQNGNLIRQTYYGESDIDGGTKLLEIANQELMIFGFTRNYGATSRDFYLLKINAIGDSLWSKRYGGNGYEESQSFLRTQNGGYLLNGHSSSTDPNHNMYGVKVDINGNQIWEMNFGGSQHDGGQALLINKAGNYVFVGSTESFGNGMQDVLFIVTNPNGQELLTHYFGGNQNDQIDDIIEFGDYYYMVGHSNSFGAGDKDVYLIKNHK